MRSGLRCTAPSGSGARSTPWRHVVPPGGTILRTCGTALCRKPGLRWAVRGALWGLGACMRAVPAVPRDTQRWTAAALAQQKTGGAGPPATSARPGRQTHVPRHVAPGCRPQAWQACTSPSAGVQCTSCWSRDMGWSQLATPRTDPHPHPPFGSFIQPCGGWTWKRGRSGSTACTCCTRRSSQRGGGGVNQAVCLRRDQRRTRCPEIRGWGSQAAGSAAWACHPVQSVKTCRRLREGPAGATGIGESDGCRVQAPPVPGAGAGGRRCASDPRGAHARCLPIQGILERHHALSTHLSPHLLVLEAASAAHRG